MAVRIVEHEGMSVGFSDDINRPGDPLDALRRLAEARDRKRDIAALTMNAAISLAGRIDVDIALWYYRPTAPEGDTLTRTTPYTPQARRGNFARRRERTDESARGQD